MEAPILDGFAVAAVYDRQIAAIVRKKGGEVHDPHRGLARTSN
jgi:hypothetical protein